jgi:hypothetical protein
VRGFRHICGTDPADPRIRRSHAPTHLLYSTRYVLWHAQLLRAGVALTGSPTPPAAREQKSGEGAPSRRHVFVCGRPGVVTIELHMLLYADSPTLFFATHLLLLLLLPMNQRER